MSLPDRHSGGRREARYYLIFLNSIPGRSLSPEMVAQHAAHIAELDNGGKRILAGPIPERAGSLIVLRAVSLAEAKAIAEEGFMVRGQYQAYEFGTRFMSNHQNDYQPKIHPETQP